MASETSGSSDPTSLVERLISSRNRDLSLLFPFLFGFTGISSSILQPIQNPDQENPDHVATSNPTRDRVIIINPLTQGMLVIEGSSLSLDSFLQDLLISKDAQPPASRASIEAMPSVEIREGEEEVGECVVCLEEWKIGGFVKEMPCKHKFHGECIEKWLGIHGSCPVCRYKMPVDDHDDAAKKIAAGSGGERREGRREIWVSYSFSSDRRSGNSNQTGANENASLGSSNADDHEME